MSMSIFPFYEALSLLGTWQDASEDQQGHATFIVSKVKRTTGQMQPGFS